MLIIITTLCYIINKTTILVDRLEKVENIMFKKIRASLSHSLILFLFLLLVDSHLNVQELYMHFPSSDCDCCPISQVG